MNNAQIAAGLTRLQVKLYLAEAVEKGNVKMAGLMMFYWDQHIQADGFVSEEELVDLFVLRRHIKEMIKK